MSLPVELVILVLSGFVGCLIVIGSATGTLDRILLVVATAFGAVNVVGGFLVTDRMLGMFRPRPRVEDAATRTKNGSAE